MTCVLRWLAFFFDGFIHSTFLLPTTTCHHKTEICFGKESTDQQTNSETSLHQTDNNTTHHLVTEDANVAAFRKNNTNNKLQKGDRYQDLKKEHQERI